MSRPCQTVGRLTQRHRKLQLFQVRPQTRLDGNQHEGGVETLLKVAKIPKDALTFREESLQRTRYPKENGQYGFETHCYLGRTNHRDKKAFSCLWPPL